MSENNTLLAKQAEEVVIGLVDLEVVSEVKVKVRHKYVCITEGCLQRGEIRLAQHSACPCCGKQRAYMGLSFEFLDGRND